MRIENQGIAEITAEGNLYLLRNAIIVQAADEYRELMTKVRRRNEKHRDHLKYEIRNVDNFFHSGWYDTLTDIDGDYILKRIRREVICGKYKHSQPLNIKVFGGWKVARLKPSVCRSSSTSRTEE